MKEKPKKTKKIGIGLVAAGIILLAVGSFLGFNRNNFFNMHRTAQESTSEGLNGFNNINIEADFAEIRIRESDRYYIGTSSNGSNIRYTNTNGELRVVEKERTGGFNFARYSMDSLLEIEVPKGSIINNMSLDGGAGSISINSLNIENIDIELGAGEAIFDNVESKKLIAKTGVGKFYYSGKIMGDIKVESGVGSVDMDLIGNPDDYFVNIDAGLGYITFNGNTVSMGEMTFGDEGRPYRVTGDIGVGDGSISIRQE